MLKFLLIIAILIQAVAAVFALRLVRTTKYNSVWILFIAGFLLLSIDRVMQFMLVNGHGVPGIAFAYTGVVVSFCLSVGVMYAIQTLINIIIPSGSAKAALTMPIMAPFSDVIGISRQVTVMAFQFGDGFTNMITPTSAVLMGALGIARIPYQVWVRWFWKLLLLFVALGFVLLVPMVV